MQETETLFEQFAPISTEQWEEMLKKDLKGADYEKKLVWQTLEGMKIKPYYRSEDLKNAPQRNHLPGNFPYTRGTKDNNDWLIREEIHVLNKNEANNQALKAIENGANSIEFVLYDDAVKSLHSFEQLLYKINPEEIEINFTAFGQNPVFVEYLLADIVKMKFDPNKVCGSITLDPLGFILLHGRTCSGPIADIFQNLNELIRRIHERLPRYKVITVNAQHVHNAGGHAVQELAYALSMGAEYLHRMTARGTAADYIANHMTFVFAAGTNYFMEIAKFRAARIMWASLVEKYAPQDPQAAKMRIHARTSEWTTTNYDVHVNLLRSTTQTMAAALGGADSITTLPYNYANGQHDDELARRIARNQQIILKEEAHFNKVIDPAAGSYYIEHLTTELIENAWKLFNKVEELGGFMKAFVSGFIHADIEKTAQTRRENIATRKEILLGVNEYPNPLDEMDVAIDYQLQKENKEIADIGLIGKPIRKFRAAYNFEHLRRKVETMQRRPMAMMLTYGDPAMRKARAGFASDFFNSIGFRTSNHPGYKNIDEAVADVEQYKPEMVVLCSSDQEYAEFARKIDAQMKHKAVRVVAGYPKDSFTELKQAGFDQFIHTKSNVIETAEVLLNKLG